ncbi:CinA family protein [Microbacterium sp. ZW T5_56]|uniref:CinA family protein n=1 Tax=Microbacterium sp. ZW T5_56 TaxID=3378081 RepID=UPI0038548A36
MTATDLLDTLVERGWTIACAESLTGGLLTSALVDVPGASRVVRGGVVAYDTDVKRAVLGVDANLLAQRGAVDADVAWQMADGVRSALATAAGPAHVGLATTGVAGPDPQDGQAVGTVFVAVASPIGTEVRRLQLSGDRSTIRRVTVAEVIALAQETLSAR